MTYFIIRVLIGALVVALSLLVARMAKSIFDDEAFNDDGPKENSSIDDNSF